MNEFEHDEQVTVIEWADNHTRQFKELAWLFAIPNGGHRSKAQAGKLKAEGVRAGVADLCLPIARRGYNALYIEMKYVNRFRASKTKDTRLTQDEIYKVARKNMSTDQLKFEVHCDAENNLYQTCGNNEAAIALLQWYLKGDKSSVSLAALNAFGEGVKSDFEKEGNRDAE